MSTDRLAEIEQFFTEWYHWEDHFPDDYIEWLIEEVKRLRYETLDCGQEILDIIEYSYNLDGRHMVVAPHIFRDMMQAIGERLVSNQRTSESAQQQRQTD